jgi:glucose/arabinose dehydrogenase
MQVHIGKVCLFGLALAAALACGGGGGGTTAPRGPAVAFAVAFGGLAFENPVKLVQHPTNDDRWYVVEQEGKVWTFLASDPDDSLELALDVVADDGINLGNVNDEQGLLSLAFDSDFASTGEIYIAYTDENDDDSILARYDSGDNGLTFEFDEILLAIAHPNGNHNGGDLALGPDGYLYYSMGDGGGVSNNPPFTQNPDKLLGSVMRLDVNGTPPMGKTYAIPDDNPFEANPQCDTDGLSPASMPCPEIFALGFRNPWRMSFDPDTDLLWLGDVGENTQEEIDQVVNGGNYGWSCIEGTHELVGPGNPACDFASFEDPEVVHNRSQAAAITGGVVYRGTDIPELVGWYVYGDFVEQNFFAFDADTPGADAVQLDLPPHNVSAFGQARSGKIYAVVFGNPSILEIVAAPPGP